ncbi:hypothetical protein PPYR_03096 [Photinus pyralis]|uniref:Uncharacterized protein n=1 Tax=Photinus pyralis TaxID=7054 RepID=A0A5N4A1W9_PHOPY|nr:cuticle protein 7-like [Photinus pyralis]KAB0791296.1 hypothetical protein PPYR_03096 [Photinus pyralis]
MEIKFVQCLILLPFVWAVPPEPELDLPPRPYAFGYAAGRFAGHIDRTHSEISTGDGVVKGTYSYVDPRHQIRTVDYIADKQGFRAVLNHSPLPLPVDSPVVAAAKERHLQQYNAIAHSHQAPPGYLVVPADSAAVHHAKVKHLSLYEQIAAEHARIAHERGAFEAETADPHVV